MLFSKYKKWLVFRPAAQFKQNQDEKWRPNLVCPAIFTTQQATAMSQDK
jgi:hypothetical protein